MTANMAQQHNVECLVVGAGPAGLAAATALALIGADVALAGLPAAGEAAPPAAEDIRTAALFPMVVQMLRNLGAWPALEAHCAPLLGIRIVDDTGHLLRAPEVSFPACEIGLPDLGHNVPNAALSQALIDTARTAGVALTDGGQLIALETGAGGAMATLADGSQVRARLIVGADGRNSICRAAAGIGVRRWSYGQAAIAVRFAHSRPHRGFSTELQRPAGPCTAVPLPGLSSSLVWMERTAEAGQLMAATPSVFVEQLSRRFQGLLGSISDLGQRRSFPLSGLAAETLARSRVALVGEAGHVIPPIGAQGLNLGMFDAATLAEHVAAARTEGRDIGGPAVLEGYARARAADVRRRIGAVDILNRSLTSGLLPLDLARGAGLHALAAVPALRRRIMAAGLAPSGPVPRVMLAAKPRETLEP